MAVALTSQPPLPIPANGFTALTDQLPEDWKKPVAELVASAAVMYRHVKDYNHTIENINHLEGFVNAKTVPDRSTVQTFLDKVKNFKDDFKKNYLDLVCKDGSCEKSFDEIWESARGEVMDQLKKEKQEAANNCVKTQAIVSAVVLVIEFNAVYSVWGNIENAENVTRECRERDIPEIRRRMNALTPRASELRTTIEEYIGRRTDELKNRMRGLTFSLIRDLNTTRNMIADVKIQLNNQITRIGADREDQFRRGIANSAQAVGNSIQLFHLFENLTKPYALILGGISATFGLLAAANFYNCVVCKDTLIALRGSLTTIQTLENYVEEVNELTTQAEALYLGGQ